MNNKRKCCHNLNSKDCTIKILQRKFMVEPNVIQGVCTCCGKSFKYKNEDANITSEKEE